MFQFFLIDSFGQRYIPYKDESNDLWGIMDKTTSIPVVLGTFYKVFNYSDSLFVVYKDNMHYGVVDKRGKFIIDYTETTFWLYKANYLGNQYPFDTVNNCRLQECPFFNPRHEVNMHVFFIDYNQNCIPSDYFPCPSWKKMVNNIIPPYLQLIQKGEIQRWKNNIDSAVFYCKQAIEANPKNASVYYWGANLFIENFQENIKARNNKQYESYYPWIKFCIDKADELETRNPYKDWILSRKFDFYKKNLKDSKSAKEIKKRRKELRKNK